MSDVPDEPTGESAFGDEIFPGQDEPETSSRTPLTGRSIAIASARAAVGLVGLGVAAVSIAGAALLPLPTLGSSAPSQLITPVPTAQQLVCPGAVLRLSDESGQGATALSPLGRPTLTSAASSGAVDLRPVDSSDADTGGTTEAPTIISTPPTGDDSAGRVLVSGAQAQQVSDTDAVGLAATDCSVATGDTWLVGGSTTVGRTTLVALANPSEVPATVDLEIFGEDGPISAPGTAGIIVPASGQRVLSLAGFAPGIASPVVHVTSTGGQVTATLQQSVVRGLQPGGVDIVGSSEPSADSIIPGVRRTASEQAEALSAGGEDFVDSRTVLRLFAPGDEDVALTVSVIPEDGAEGGDSFALDLDAGRVTEVEIGELETGNYTVRIQADTPVVAGVRVTAASGGATDFFWAVPSAELAGQAQLTVADGPSPILHVANPTDDPVDVAVTPLDGGAATTLSVPAGGSALLAVVAGNSYGLSGFERVNAAISFAGDGMVARYGIRPPGVGSSPLTIYN